MGEKASSRLSSVVKHKVILLIIIAAIKKEKGGGSNYCKSELTIRVPPFMLETRIALVCLCDNFDDCCKSCSNNVCLYLNAYLAIMIS